MEPCAASTATARLGTNDPSRQEKAIMTAKKATRSIYAHHILHRAISGPVERIEFRFERHEAIVYLRQGCTDMSGTIVECLKMDPDVQSILTLTGKEPYTRPNGELLGSYLLDTQYIKRDGAWHAVAWAHHPNAPISAQDEVQLDDGSVASVIDMALRRPGRVSDGEGGWPHEKALEKLQESLLLAVRETKHPPKTLTCWKCGKPATWTGDYSSGCDDHTQENPDACD
jgi:hypothetical protein